MPNTANTPTPPQRSTRDIALKALVKAVLLPLLIVVVNTVREGWSPGTTALTIGIGVPLLWTALFVADYYVQPAVERKNAQRRANQRNGQGRAQGPRNGQISRNGQGSRNGRNAQNRSSAGKNAPKRKSKRR